MGNESSNQSSDVSCNARGWIHTVELTPTYMSPSSPVRTRRSNMSSIDLSHISLCSSASAPCGHTQTAEQSQLAVCMGLLASRLLASTRSCPAHTNTAPKAAAEGSKAMVNDISESVLRRGHERSSNP